jgi:hypothetical protein
MKTPNTHSRDWKVQTYHAGSIVDTRRFETIEEASRFSHDLNALLETCSLDGQKMYCEVLFHSERPAEILLDWL